MATSGRLGTVVAGRRLLLLALALLLLLACSGLSGVAAARTRLKQKLFAPGLTALHTRISTSDPANTPMSAAEFLAGGHGGGEGGLLQRWEAALEAAPLRPMRLEQQVLTQSQLQHAQQSEQAQDAALIEQQWVVHGKRAADYEPKHWGPDPAGAARPMRMQQQGGGAEPTPINNLSGALGVQSTAIPWEYRHYAGKLNSHRKAEPLVYTPLVLAKDAQGGSALDLTSVLNRKYAEQRRGQMPQYSKTLSALTDFEPTPQAPTAHWLPQLPAEQGPKKTWEKHFLDLYAPTPPPLLAPVPPQPPRKAQDVSLLQTRSTTKIALPEILTRMPRSQPLVSTLRGADQHPVPFRDVEGEERAMRRSREVDLAAPARADEWMQEHALAAVYLEQEVHIESPALQSIDVSMPFPMMQEEFSEWE